MTLHLSKEIQNLIDRRVAEAGYDSAQAYVEKLILEDEARQLRARAEVAGPPIDEYIESLPPEKQAKAKKVLEQMLLEGLNSESILADDAFWEKKKSDYIKRQQSKRQAQA
ncbi:MAG: hypothetical protein WD768_21440 [Phycisphaeraceae bacterium]